MFITSNQLAYNSLQEQQRHNIATEVEASRHNQVTENEVIRHNFVTEGIQRDTLSEQKRHNAVTEVLTQHQIAANYEVGLANAAATRYAAQLNASAAKYAADTQRRIAVSNQANQLRIQQMRSSTEILKNRESIANTSYIASLQRSLTRSEGAKNRENEANIASTKLMGNLTQGALQAAIQAAGTTGGKK